MPRRRSGALSRPFCSLLAIVLACAACGRDDEFVINTHDDAARAGIDLLQEMLAILEGVTDESSAQVASVFMRALVDRTHAVVDQVRALPPVTVEAGKRLDERFRGRMQTVIRQLQFVGANARLDPDLYKAYEAMSEAMSEFG